MNCQKKRCLGIILGLILVTLCLLFGTSCYCPHSETYTKVVNEANCFTLGQRDTICKRCETILESNALKKTSHTFGEYKLTVLPSVSAPGEEVRTCYVCLKEEKREYYCKHEETSNKVIKEATCYELGQVDTICNMCESILESNTLEKIEHEFGDYELIIEPRECEPGIEVRTCLVCLEQEEREYYCPHKETFNKVIKEATCYDFGEIATICDMCEIILESNTLEKNEHTFGDYELIVKPSASKSGLEVRTCLVCLKQEEREYLCSHPVNLKEDWKYIKYATPFEEGERYRNCYICGTKLTENYKIPMLEKNSIYITGTDIRHSFVISSFTQNAVDKYDIVYSEDSSLGKENPFILGHNIGTFCMLDQTKVGAYIYINLNGIIESYEVVVSEYGLQNSSRSDIIGQTTRTSILHQYETKTLHIYTCYGINPYGRWIVLARKV